MSDDGPAKSKWLLDKSRTPRELLRFINTGMMVRQHHFEIARCALEVRVSEIAEVSTRRITRLTVALLIFTIFLFGTELLKMYVPKHTDTQPHYNQVADQTKVIPAPH